MGIRFEKRLEAVTAYLTGTSSLRKISEEFGIHYNTLFRWVKCFRAKGKSGLMDSPVYHRPWNRFSPELEKIIVDLRERDPNLSLVSTKNELKKRGIEVSVKGIWNVWRRYGFAGFDKSKLSNDFDDFIPLPSEVSKGIIEVRRCLKSQREREAAEIVNKLPVCPDGEILENIPDRFLSLGRRLEKLSYLFGKIPFAEYRRKIRTLRKELLRKEKRYSALRAGIKEILVLEWIGKPREQLDLIKTLKKILGSKKRSLNNSLWFTLHASEFIAYIRLTEIERAIRSLKECIRLSRTFSSPSFLQDLATLYSYLGYHREMGQIIEKVLNMVGEKEKDGLLSRLAITKCNEGDYRMGRRILRKMREKDSTVIRLVKAYCYIGEGKVEKAREHAKVGLFKAKEQGIMGYMSSASFVLAEVSSALREEEKTKLLLQRYLPLLRKLGMNISVISREVVLDRIPIPRSVQKIRTIRLALLLKEAERSGRIGDYRKAYAFAQRYSLLGIFHRLVLLIPNPVLKMIEKGKDTGLPRVIVNLPVFRREIPVYFIKFLGRLIVYKNQRYLRVKLGLKDTSFLIYLALSKQRRINLDKIYKNYWYRCKNPSRNLAHLLVRIRKSLRIPSHLLYVKEERLCNDCYFSTDYDEYLEHIAQAKALQRGGKWNFALKEYKMGFSFFRDEPFRRMYDEWSDDKRIEILFSLEREASLFIRELFSRGKKKDALTFMRRMVKIVPRLEDL
jgi:transposase